MLMQVQAEAAANKAVGARDHDDRFLACRWLKLIHLNLRLWFADCVLDRRQTIANNGALRS